MQKTIFILIILLITKSCKKEEVIVGDLAFLAGDYEWVYSVNHEQTEFHTTQEVQNSYGIRITSDNNIYFFKDGEKMFRYRIISSIVNERQQSIFYKKGRNDSGYLEFSGDTIYVFELPFRNIKNYYLKIR